MILPAVMEPEEGDAHNVFIDGMLTSPASEDYNLPPALELVDQFRRFLHSQVQVSENRWVRFAGGSKQIASQYVA
jgi:hypothetical protein